MAALINPVCFSGSAREGSLNTKLAAAAAATGVSPAVSARLFDLRDYAMPVHNGDLETRVFAISAASPGGYGGVCSLLAVRTVLEIGLEAPVIPEQIAVANAGQAFGEDGALKDDRMRGLLTRVIERIVGTAARLAA